MELIQSTEPLAGETGMLLLLVFCAVREGNMRSSPVAGTAALSVWSSQLADVFQLLLTPPPTHVRVAGARRVSRCSMSKRRIAREGARCLMVLWDGRTKRASQRRKLKIGM